VENQLAAAFERAPEFGTRTLGNPYRRLIRVCRCLAHLLHSSNWCGRVRLEFVSYASLVLTAAVLFYAAFTDLKRHSIPNELVIVLVLLYAAHAITEKHWADIPWDVGFALLILLVLLYVYSFRWIGGGDVKLLTVALLWAGIHCALAFAEILLAAATIHAAVVKIIYARHPIGDEALRMAFSPSIAVALIGVLMLGCRQ